MNHLFKRGMAFVLSGTILFQSVMMANAVENISVNRVYDNSVSENTLYDRSISENMILENDDMESGISDDHISQNDETAVEETLGEALLNYVYLESPYLKTPEVQRVATQIGEEGLEIDRAVLTYKNYRTNQSYEVQSNGELSSGNFVLFEIPFQDESQSGIYQLDSITFYAGEESKNVELASTGIQAYFGVNEEVMLTNESSDVTQDEQYVLETSIVTIDEDGVEHAAASIEEAIENAQAGTANEQLSKAKANDGNVVVVIDPGHDNTHAGARNTTGLKEEELTLKIAEYCKEELEKYAGVDIYMTRSTSVCPHPGTTSAVCNSNRVAYAKSVGANAYVSIHLNTAAATSASGAEVFYPNSNYNPTIGSQGRKLADKIQSKLVGLGLNDRGIKIMYSQDGSTYPDGSLADYYGVIKNSKLNGFPGIIIEHAFMSNTSDVNNFLSTEEGLKKLGVADAQGIAEYFELTEGSKIGFETDGLKFTEVDNIAGTFVANLSNITPADKVSKVQFKVYTKSDKSDMKVYNAKKLADGTYQAKIYASKHNNVEGTYVVEACIVDTNGTISTVAYSTLDLIPKFKAKLSASVVGNNNTSYRISASGISSASSVRVLFYYKKDGKTKGAYYKAKKDANGIWYADVPLKKMINEGKYKVYVYATTAYGNEKQAATKTFTYERKMSVTAKATSAAQKKFKITVGGLAYASKVEVEVYSKTGGKDDLKKYKAKKNAEGVWYYNVPIKKHKTSGKYYASVYATIGGKRIYVGKKSFNVSGPTQAKTSISYNSVKANMTVNITNLSSPSGIKTVKVKVWTKKDKSDAKWFNAKQNKDGYKATIKMSKFNYYYGKYSMEVYATDNNNIYEMVKKTSKKIQSPTVSVSATVNKAHTKSKITVADLSYAKKMEIRVWSKTGGKKTMKKYKAKKNADGVWYYNVKLSVFKQSGKFQVQAYATIGSKSYMVGSTSFSGSGVDNEEESGYYTIMGESEVTLNQLISYYQANATYPAFYANSDAPTLKKFCQIYMKECETEGVKVEVAFTQAMKETNFLRYGGDVSIEQYNFAGIGATGNGVPGNSFSSVTIGVRAQVQHLKAYASTESLVNEVVDPRFKYVTRGICPYVEWLGINENPNHVGWATAVGYGNNIVERIKTLKSY